MELKFEVFGQPVAKSHQVELNVIDAENSRLLLTVFTIFCFDFVLFNFLLALVGKAEVALAQQVVVDPVEVICLVHQIKVEGFVAVLLDILLHGFHLFHQVLGVWYLEQNVVGYLVPLQECELPLLLLHAPLSDRFQLQLLSPLAAARGFGDKGEESLLLRRVGYTQTPYPR